MEKAINTEINSQLKLNLHRQMLRIRMLDEKIVDLYAEQEMRCPVHLSIGQEAPPVGVCAHLCPDDYVMSAHRAHGHYLAKGGNLKAMVAELYGKASGCTSGIGGSMHLLDLEAGFLGAVPIIGSTIPISVGAAWGAVLRHESRVVVSFFGEAAVEEGVFHEAINFASVKKLPVIFVCENNLYSVYSPLPVRRAEGHEVVEVARGHGVSAWQADGNDVVAVYSLAKEAIARARAGMGPSFLELMTYRWREHCGPNYDNDIGYRTSAEFEEWKKNCPILRIEDSLREDGALTEELKLQVQTELQTEINEAFQSAKEAPFPEANKLMENVYAS